MANGRRANKPAQPLDENALYEYAVRALGRQMRTAAELARLMRAKVKSDEGGEEKISAVLARLRERQYLDDAAFAGVYVRLRQENQCFGRRRVERELARKGVARALIAGAVEAAYRETGEEELARHYLARRRIAKPEDAKATARVARRLAGAGFSIPTISKILKNWEIDLPEEELTALDDEAEPDG